MPEFTGTEEEFVGRAGTSLRLPLDRSRKDYACTVASWLLTQSKAHPAWTQYSLCGVKLAWTPGFPPPRLQFPEATHEIVLVVLDPRAGTQTPETMRRYADTNDPEYGKLPILTPINIAWQFEGTDEECEKLVAAAAWGVANGVLWPETGDAPTYIRNSWAGSLKLTLSHLRGIPHPPH